MATITNGTILNSVSDELKIQSAGQPIPSVTEDKIQITYPIVPKTNICKGITVSASGDNTIFTTSSSQDFYLTFASIMYSADATADSTVAVMYFTDENGTLTYFLGVVKNTTTAMQTTQNIAFPYPIKLKRGSTIGYVTTYTVGTSAARLAIGGFYL